MTVGMMLVILAVAGIVLYVALSIVAMVTMDSGPDWLTVGSYFSARVCCFIAIVAVLALAWRGIGIHVHLDIDQ